MNWKQAKALFLYSNLLNWHFYLPALVEIAVRSLDLCFAEAAQLLAGNECDRTDLSNPSERGSVGKRQPPGGA
jgi:hypothetical protein